MSYLSFSDSIDRSSSLRVLEMEAEALLARLGGIGVTVLAQLRSIDCLLDQPRR